MKNGYLFYINNIWALISHRHFKGWGRKKTGRFGAWLHSIVGGRLTLMEDGFLGISSLYSTQQYAFSYIEEDKGIYYDATKPSRLEDILNTYDFGADASLIHSAHEAMSLIRQYHISKYNDSVDMDEGFKQKYEMTDSDKNDVKILIVAQTLGDMSLKYGLTDRFSTDEMIQSAIDENPYAKIYLKVHPDVLSGKKKSDINIEKAKKQCIVIEENINPLSLLKCIDKVYTKTSQMGFEALLLGKECICFGMPFYASWGITDDRVHCDRRTRKLNVDEVFAGAYILYTKYTTMYTQNPCDILTALKEMIYLKKIEKKELDTRGYFFGFSKWKHSFVKPFFSEFKKNHIYFINPFFGDNYLELALKQGLNQESRIYVWGKKSFKDIEEYAQKHNIKILRVEDGFIRSIGLGSDLTQPYSQVIDERGIYFDPTKESDLEYILNTYDFSEELDLLERAQKVRAYLIDKKLSKYNVDTERDVYFPKNKTIVLVPGQVDDDASIKYGTKDMNNLKLLKSVRDACPEAHIIFKPHPDVLAGNRIGNIDKDEALMYCDEIIENIALDSILKGIDEVHTMTSLVGFEALMRGIKVYTYGLPFYAGWGLTIDKEKLTRRARKLNIDELVSGTLLCYPRYIHPKTKQLCTIENFLSAIELEKQRHIQAKYFKIATETRNYISRKLQWVFTHKV